MTVTTLSPPPLPAGLAVEEFDTRDWRKDELIAFARTLSIPIWGKKPALAARVRRKLLAKHARAAEADATAPQATTVIAHDSAPEATTVVADASAPEATTVTPDAITHTEVAAVAQSTSEPTEISRPQFFRDVPGLTRSQALSAWYASRKASGGASQ